MSDKEIIFTVPMSGTCQFNNNTMKLLHNEPYVLIAKSERDALKSDYDALKKENEELSTSESEYQKVCEFIAKNFGDLSCCYDAEDVIGLAQSAVDRLKSKLEKAEKVISSINLEFKTYGLFHYDDCTSLYDEDEKCSCGSFSAENRINKAIREYMKGEG